MKNLIEEIEKLKPQIITDKYSDGFQNAIKMVLNKINQYNIITAPKSIKLSEIINKIKGKSNVEIYFNRERNAIGYGEYDEDWHQNTWQPFVIFRDTKIIRICMPMAEITRWLYTLWIAGTEIIDDLEGDSNE